MLCRVKRSKLVKLCVLSHLGLTCLTFFAIEIWQGKDYEKTYNNAVHTKLVVQKYFKAYSLGCSVQTLEIPAWEALLNCNQP